jgi:hypothetical protein
MLQFVQSIGEQLLSPLKQQDFDAFVVGLVGHFVCLLWNESINHRCVCLFCNHVCGRVCISLFSYLSMCLSMSFDSPCQQGSSCACVFPGFAGGMARQIIDGMVVSVSPHHMIACAKCQITPPPPPPPPPPPQQQSTEYSYFIKIKMKMKNKYLKKQKQVGKKLERDKRLEQEAVRHWEEISLGDFMYDRCVVFLGVESSQVE